MPDLKISELTAGTPLNTDIIPYVDLTAGETKKALKSELKGDTGAAATADAGTTTTGNPGTNASVTNSGTTSAAVFDFTIPRGDVGATGPTGPTGATGPAGADGLMTSVVGGTNITVNSTDPANPIVNADALTTADVAASTNKNYVTDAEKTVISNTTGTNTGDNAANTNSGLVHTTGNETVGGIKTHTEAINEAQGANIASATTTDIGAATGNSVHITGTTTITGLGTVQAGTRREVTFDGILTLTHNATSLILPTGANITTVAGDTCTMISEGSGNWRCVNYQREDGTALVAAGGGITPMFAAYSTGNSIAQNVTTKILNWVTNYNNGSFNTGTSTFTAPSSGVYKIDLDCMIQTLNGSGALMTAYIFLNGNLSIYTGIRYTIVEPVTYNRVTLINTAVLTSGDVLDVRILVPYTGGYFTGFNNSFSIDKIS